MLKETFECLDEGRCREYLARLDLEYPAACDRAFLDRLIERHLQRIPFENLDLMWYRREICTDLDTVYDKIIGHRRGGYCFEMNALFLGLLRGLGYETYPISCRILRQPIIKFPTHRASVVLLEGKKYFCDVGYGGIACTRAALFAEGAETETPFGLFRFEREYEGWLNQWFQPKDETLEPIRIMMAAEYPSAPVDFEAANRAMMAPGSPFTTRLTVQRLTPEGSLVLNDDKYTVRTGRDKQTALLSSREEVERILRDAFQLDV